MCIKQPQGCWGVCLSSLSTRTTNFIAETQPSHSLGSHKGYHWPERSHTFASLYPEQPPLSQLLFFPGLKGWKTLVNYKGIAGRPPCLELWLDICPFEHLATEWPYHKLGMLASEARKCATRLPSETMENELLVLHLRLVEPVKWLPVNSLAL